MSKQKVGSKCGKSCFLLLVNPYVLKRFHDHIRCQGKHNFYVWVIFLFPYITRNRILFVLPFRRILWVLTLQYVAKSIATCKKKSLYVQFVCLRLIFEFTTRMRTSSKSDFLNIYNQLNIPYDHNSVFYMYSVFYLIDTFLLENYLNRNVLRQNSLRVSTLQYTRILITF